MLSSCHIWSLLPSNGELRCRLFEVNCLTIGCRSGFHSLFSSAAKDCPLASSNFELRTSLVFAIHTLLDVIVTGAWNVSLYSLIDSVRLLMNMHGRSIGSLRAECVATDSRICWIVFTTWTLGCAQLPAVCSLFDLTKVRIVLAWTCLESLRLLLLQILAI